MNDIAALIEALMKAHASDLKRTAYVMLGDDALSEDVTQETFISFYKNLWTKSLISLIYPQAMSR